MRSPRELIILIVYLTGCQEQSSLRSKGRRDLCSQGKNEDLLAGYFGFDSRDSFDYLYYDLLTLRGSDFSDLHFPCSNSKPKTYLCILEKRGISTNHNFNLE